MAHKDWMRSSRRVSHKIDVTTYSGPASEVKITYSGDMYETLNNTTTEINIEQLSTNNGSGKNVGFFDGPEMSIHLSSEKLSSNYKDLNGEIYGNTRFCTNYITDINGIIKGKFNREERNYFDFEILPEKDVDIVPTSRYLQISGNKNTNDFPVDFSIKNNSNGKEVVVVGNSKVDCIVDFGEEVVITDGLYIKITKWSKPYSSVKLSYVGFRVNFDASDLFRTYSIDDGCNYDGGDSFSYGVKSNTGSLELYKDKKNKGSVKTATKEEVDNILTSRIFSYTHSNTTVVDEGIVIDGVKTYYIKNNEDFNGNFLHIIRPIDWNYDRLNSGYGLVSFDVYNDSNEDLYINPVMKFICKDGADNYKWKVFQFVGAGKDIVFVGAKTKQRVSYIYSNKNNPVDNLYIRKEGANYLYFDVYNKNKVRIKTGDGYDNSTLYKFNISNIYCGIMTDTQVENLSLSQNTNYGNKVYYDSNLNKIIVLDPSQKPCKLKSKIESIVQGVMPNIKISVATAGDTFKQLCNMWVTDYNYDQNGITTSFKLSDIFYVLQKITHNGILLKEYKNVLVDEYTTICLQKGFLSDVDLIESLNLDYNHINVNNTPNIEAVIPMCIDKIGENYFDILNDSSIATNTFLIQDQKDDDLSFIYCNKEQRNDKFDILNTECYTISDKRNEKNSIKRIDISCVVVDENQYSEEMQNNIIYEDEDFTESSFKCYLLKDIKTEKDYYEGSIFEESIPYIMMKDISISGEAKIPFSLYKKYNKFTVALKCATAYRTYINYYSDIDIVGEIAGGQSERLYLQKIDEENETVEYTKDLSKIEDTQTTITVGTSQIEYVSGDSEYVTLKYTLNKSPYNYKSMFGGQFMSISYLLPGEENLFTKYIQKYLGAYKVVILGGNRDYDVSDVSYSDISGKTLDISSNTFIQQNGYIYGDNDSNLPFVLAKDIYDEYKNGKKIVKIDYIGSPYLKVYDIITLENGISYRILKITHISNGGGFKQQIIAMEKEN